MTSKATRRPLSAKSRTLPLLGPAFVAAVAYVDPGNFATNTTAGAKFGAMLVWVVVGANLMAMLVQWLTARLGLATGKGLAAVCRERFSGGTSKLLWVQAELVAMATDLAEIVGAAVALHMLFGVPPLPAGLIAAVVATALLELDRRGHRRFEIVIVGMLAVILLGFLYSAFHADGDLQGLAGGMIPRFDGSESVLLAVGIIGATVMPHVIYLHSTLVARRPDGRDRESIRRRLRATKTDVIAALGIAGVVNLAMLWVAATLLSGLPGGAPETLEGAQKAYGEIAGQGTAIAFALALLASGFASASVGTFSGQVVMEEFTGWRIPILIRRLVTVLPALVVLAIGADPTAALVASQVVLSFGIPFALIPLVRFTASREVMGEWAVGRLITAAACAIATLIILLNVLLVWLALTG
ncbi:MAG: Nramp family divalent metal transporter [Actinomycetes bacterium]